MNLLPVPRLRALRPRLRRSTSSRVGRNTFCFMVENGDVLGNICLAGCTSPVDD